MSWNSISFNSCPTHTITHTYIHHPFKSRFIGANFKIYYLSAASSLIEEHNWGASLLVGRTAGHQATASASTTSPYAKFYFIVSHFWYNLTDVPWPVMFSSGLPCNLPFPSCLGVPKDSGSDELLPSSMGNREPVILNVYDMVSFVNKEDFSPTIEQWLSVSVSSS